MSDNNQHTKRFINLVKKIKGGVFAMNVDNALNSGLRNPKLVFALVQPAPEDANEKYLSAKFYAGVEDTLKIVDLLMRAKPTSEEEQKLLTIYQGGFNGNKNRNCVEARVFTLSTRLFKGAPYYRFTIENCVGIQSQTTNGAGQKVPGVVKPATGSQAHTFAKNSYGASRDEAMYIAHMLRMELQAWRTAVNFDMYFHPEKFRYNGGNGGNNATAQKPPTAGQSQPPTAA